MTARYLQPFAIALLVTFCLFYLMQALVMGSQRVTRPDATNVPVDFTRAITESELETKDRTLPEKTAPVPPPAPPVLEIASAPEPRVPTPPNAVPRLVQDLRLAGGIELGEPVSDTEALPMVRIEPRYPSRARARGIEGWVRVVFTVGPTGSVAQARIEESEPKGIFDAAALRAVEKWKYKPRIVGGRPVARSDLRVTLQFRIED